MQIADLVRYDPILNCFVLKDFVKKYPPTWPDGTPKSMNNAFNWRAGIADVPAAPKAAKPNARSKDLHSNGNINTYTKASATRTPYGRSGKFQDFKSKL